MHVLAWVLVVQGLVVAGYWLGWQTEWIVALLFIIAAAVIGYIGIEK